jgi:hypothetical protein
MEETYFVICQREIDFFSDLYRTVTKLERCIRTGSEERTSLNVIEIITKTTIASERLLKSSSTRINKKGMRTDDNCGHRQSDRNVHGTQTYLWQ